MSPHNTILLLLGQIALILATSRLMGMLFARFRQPQVVGEMVAGIMLGPSLLGFISAWALSAGWLSFDLSTTIFPKESIPNLNILSQVGVIFFLFLIGLELDPKLMRNRGHAAVVISHASIVVPFLLGAALTLYLYPRLFNNAPHMRFTAVALFMGAAMSITAFPVLARILTERNLHKTKVGAVAITCAAVDDVSAWCMLAFVVAIARAEGLQNAVLTAVLSAAYVLAMFFLVKPMLTRLQAVYDRQGRLGQNMMAIIILLTLLSAFTTEKIGIHALFGAFLMGAIMPKGTRFVRHLSEKLEDYTVVFLLPIFFAYTGLKTSIGLLNNAELWLDTLLIIAVACAGKFGGSMVAARLCGIPLRESSAIGILMNTRGLMELVILNIGMELGVITDGVFAMMVIMALVTTALTTPVLAWVYPQRLFGADQQGKPKGVSGYSVLIPVANPTSGGSLLRLADMIVEPDEETRVYALHLRRPGDREAYRTDLEESEGISGPLEALMSQPHAIPVEPITFTSRDVAADIVRVSQAWRVNLVLMGFHRPVVGATILGGTVHRVLIGSDADVAIFVDRGLARTRKVLVPFMGSRHDHMALALANQMAKNTGASVTVLHVITPHTSAEKIGAKEAVDRVFQDPAQPTPVTFRMLEDPSPVDAVLREANNFDLVIVGVSEEWGLESHLFGFRPERIAQESRTSLLIVRAHESRAVPAPSQTSEAPAQSN